MAEFKLEGVAQMSGRLAFAGAKLKSESRAAVRIEGKSILAVSQQRVPVKEGVLKRTGKSRDQTLKGINIGVKISYSGPQAVAIHEFPPHASHPPSWKNVRGSLVFTTPGTGHKFLENPIKEAAGGMARRIAGKISL